MLNINRMKCKYTTCLSRKGRRYTSRFHRKGNKPIGCLCLLQRDCMRSHHHHPLGQLYLHPFPLLAPVVLRVVLQVQRYLHPHPHLQLQLSSQHPLILIMQITTKLPRRCMNQHCRGKIGQGF